jgi:hypothetical protein
MRRVTIRLWTPLWNLSLSGASLRASFRFTLPGSFRFGGRSLQRATRLQLYYRSNMNPVRTNSVPTFIGEPNGTLNGIMGSRENTNYNLEIRGRGAVVQKRIFAKILGVNCRVRYG